MIAPAVPASRLPWTFLGRSTPWNLKPLAQIWTTIREQMTRGAPEAEKGVRRQEGDPVRVIVR